MWAEVEVSVGPASPGVEVAVGPELGLVQSVDTATGPDSNTWGCGVDAASGPEARQAWRALGMVDAAN